MEINKDCRVEVSGWDEKENFFVEKVYLDPEPEGGKEIAVKSSLREGCVLFLRLLQPISNGSDFPVAFQAVNIAKKDADGRTRVRLQQLRPRVKYHDVIVASDHSAIKVA